MSTPNKNCKNDDGVCVMNDMLQNMSTVDAEETTLSVCANCGKQGSDVNNTCNKCKQVKYCNAACKKKHRHKHKKECEESLLALSYSYMTKNYSNNLHQQKIVQSVFYECQHYILEGFTWHVVERLFAADAPMQIHL